MKIADLQRYFTDLAKLLLATDGKKSSSELSRIAEALQPFRDLDLAQFGDFLARAEDYSRTGFISIVAQKSKPPPGRKPTSPRSGRRSSIFTAPPPLPL